MKTILVIEDNPSKQKSLIDFFEGSNLIIKESFHSGMNELISNDKISLLILDMTLPIWDDLEIGSSNEQFAGDNILEELERRNLQTPTILFTMFDVFDNGRLTFEQLNTQYQEKYPNFYLGAVFYDSESNSWQNKLATLIDKFNNLNQNNND